MYEKITIYLRFFIDVLALPCSTSTLFKSSAISKFGLIMTVRSGSTLMLGKLLFFGVI